MGEVDVVEDTTSLEGNFVFGIKDDFMETDLIDAVNGKNVKEDEEANQGVNVEDEDVNESAKKRNLEAVIKIPKKSCVTIP